MPAKASKIKKIRGKQRRRYSGSLWGDILLFTLLILLGSFMIFPIYLSIVQSIKPPEELLLFPPKMYAVQPTVSNFRDMMKIAENMRVPFSRYVANSVLIAVVVTGVQLLFASSAAYALAKVNFPGKNFLNKMITVALLFTSTVLFIMQYLVLVGLHLIDTYFALTLPFIATPMSLFLMKQFMGQIHDSMIEAAKLDGASHFRICWQVVMPNVKPAWLTLIIFAFQSAWQITGYAFVYKEELKPIPTVLQQINSSGSVARAGATAATVVIMMIPPIIMFLIAQSNVIETMAQSGIKD